MAKPFPTREAGHDLYRRLLGGDPTASSDLAVGYLDPLIEWLAVQPRNRRLPSDFIVDAAGDAILALILNPGSYRPEKSDLESYLKMSAQGDLLNRLRREAKHRRGRTPLAAVEHSDQAGKYLGRDDDPSHPLQVKEHLSGLGDAIPCSVRAGLTAAEARVLELMLQGERKTSAYAEACGIGSRPPEEQRRIVKQVKDRLSKRLSRARRDDEQAS